MNTQCYRFNVTGARCVKDSGHKFSHKFPQSGALTVTQELAYSNTWETAIAPERKQHFIDAYVAGFMLSADLGKQVVADINKLTAQRAIVYAEMAWKNYCLALALR